jgi:hypothetical protein
MSVLNVFAEANVRDNQQPRQRLFQFAHGTLHNSRGRVSTAGLRVPGFWNSEKQNCGHAQFMRARGFFHEFIHRKLKYARHRVDGAPHFFARPNEQRQHQLIDTEPRFRYQPPQGGRLPQAARTIIRELAERVRLHRRAT